MLVIVFLRCALRLRNDPVFRPMFVLAVWLVSFGCVSAVNHQESDLLDTSCMLWSPLRCKVDHKSRHSPDTSLVNAAEATEGTWTTAVARRAQSTRRTMMAAASDALVQDRGLGTGLR